MYELVGNVNFPCSQQVEVGAGNNSAVSLRGFKTLWRRGFAYFAYFWASFEYFLCFTPHKHMYTHIELS